MQHRVVIVAQGKSEKPLPFPASIRNNGGPFSLFSPRITYIGTEIPSKNSTLISP